MLDNNASIAMRTWQEPFDLVKRKRKRKNASNGKSLNAKIRKNYLEAEATALKLPGPNLMSLHEQRLLLLMTLKT